MKQHTHFLLLSLAMFSLISLAQANPDAQQGNTRYYVDKSVNVSGNGSSWQNAFKYLQEALNASQINDEIWVAGGIYYADEGPGSLDNDPNETFLITKNLTIFGGFEGDEVSLIQRDITLNLTIISGDIQQDDTSNENGISESTNDIIGNNTFNLLTINNTDTDLVFDGFILNAAYANDGPNNTGAAIICNQSTLSLSNSVVQANRASNRAVISGCDDMHISYSDFINNRAGDVAAISTSSAVVEFSNFINNRANVQASLFYLSSANLSITNSYIQGSSSGNAGALRLQGGSLSLENVVLSGNFSNTGAAINLSSTANANLINVTIAGNHASLRGGAIDFQSTGTLNIFNSIIYNNLDNTGFNSLSSSIAGPNDANINIAHSNIAGTGGSLNWAAQNMTDGGNNSDETPYFSSTLAPQSAPSIQGDFRLTSQSNLFNQGDNTQLNSQTDILNQPRVIDEFVDLGAFESQYITDLNAVLNSTQQNITAGDVLEYTLTITNSNFQGLVDPSVRVISYFDSPSSCIWDGVYSGNASGPLVGNAELNEIISLPENTSATFTFDCDSAFFAGDITHFAQVDSINGSETNNTNNISNYTVNVSALPTDLSVTHTQYPTQSFTESNIAISLMIENSSNNPAYITQFNYDFDGQINCSWDINYLNGSNGDSSGNGDINIEISLPGNSSASMEAFCFIPSDTLNTINNTASIAWPNGTDSNSLNNNETIQTTLLHSADIAMELTSSTSTVSLGDPITYEIDVFNESSNLLSGVNITTNEPEQLGICSWSCTNNTDSDCQLTTQNGFLLDNITIQPTGHVTYFMTCTTLSEDDQGLVQLFVTVNGSGEYIDPNLFNNSATSTQQVIIFSSSFESTINN